MSIPPPKTYQAALEANLRRAERQGVKISVVPAMLRPSGATPKFFRDLAKSQKIVCKSCKKKGIICQATNLSRLSCYGCLWGRDCDRQTYMTKRGHPAKLNAESYTVAKSEGLTIIPEGAVWGDRNMQPAAMREGVPLKEEKGVAGEEGGEEEEDGERAASSNEDGVDDDDEQVDQLADDDDGEDEDASQESKDEAFAAKVGLIKKKVTSTRAKLGRTKKSIDAMDAELDTIKTLLAGLVEGKGKRVEKHELGAASSSEDEMPLSERKRPRVEANAEAGPSNTKGADTQDE
ncbi:hypothetical protein OH76DRAFT_1490164 [Lentinus brumalis]|uniref:Uncharacterized protein n=1 Tax=Lentinus brumalis TaxID=2498619 RepID=A0A371CJX6_9APHY|nr:hypothetical protein OH76DRAFT_1490164 [Polyporus brumalis]